MKRGVLRIGWILVVMALPAAVRSQIPATTLAWDGLFKEFSVPTGQRYQPFTFSVTNVSRAEVVVTQVLTSCGCTVARLPAQPWRLPPGGSGTIEGAMDLAGKFGILLKTLTVVSSAGDQILSVKINIPLPPQSDPEEMLRVRNQEIAAADRQAVFRNDCARCHLAPAYGRQGRELYGAVCGLCHEAAHRASMVPDLRTVNTHNDPQIWRAFIQHGKAGTLMPAFGEDDGGPLNDAQVDSLVRYLGGDFRKSGATTPTAPPGGPRPPFTGSTP